MRTTALLFSTLLVAAPAAAQAPLSTLAPADKVSPLGPKTLTPAHVVCTDVPVTDEPAAPLHILAPHSGDGHQLSYRDDIVVLSGGTPQGVQPRQRFFTRRFQPPRSGPRMSASERGTVRTSGWLTVIAADEHSALARVDFACDSVAAGDFLVPFTELTLPATVAPVGRTEFANLGRVLSGVDRRESFGAGDVVSVDRALASGARVAFYRDRHNDTPLVELGTGVVVEVATTTSKVVLDRIRFAVLSGDYFGVQQ